MKKPSLTLIAIGPGDPALLNGRTLDQLRAATPLILRTDHHPITAFLAEQSIPWISLDDLYDAAEDFDIFTDRAAARVMELAAGGKHPVYAVPDLQTDRTVDALFALCGQSEIDVIPGFSYADFYLSRARGLYTASAVRIISASALLSSRFDPAETALVTEIDQAPLAGDLKIFLSRFLDDEAPVCLLQAAGRPRTIPLFELDRQKHYDHLTALLLPAVDYTRRSHFTLGDLEDIMDRLRSPQGGCPWDSIQTHETLEPYMVEEAWESVIALDEGDPDHIADELGDLLFQIVFHASIGKACGEYSMDDVISHICAKMIKRHPHVFGAGHFDSAQQVADQWETIKRAETGSRTVSESLDDVSPALPSLKYAIKVNKKAMQQPAWRANPAVLAEAVREQVAALAEEASAGAVAPESMGRLLFLCTYLCHVCGLDAEIILHKTVDRFKKSFKALENKGFFEEKAPESLTFLELCVYLKHVEGEIE